MSDKTRENGAYQKKTVSILSFPVKAGTDRGEFVAETDNHLVALLPNDAVITDAFVVVKTASDAATTATVKLGNVSGGAQIMAAADIKTTGSRGSAASKLDTGTGMEVWMALTYTGATTNVGEFQVVVEYVEYTKNTGEFTNFSNS